MTVARTPTIPPDRLLRLTLADLAALIRMSDSTMDDQVRTTIVWHTPTEGTVRLPGLQPIPIHKAAGNGRMCIWRAHLDAAIAEASLVRGYSVVRPSSDERWNP